VFCCQGEDGIRDWSVTGVQTCALPICHDYSAAALARFFALADRDHIELRVEEERLRTLLRQEGWLAPGAVAGLISLPAVGADAKIGRASCREREERARGGRAGQRGSGW